MTDSKEIAATNLTSENREYLQKYAQKLTPLSKKAKWINEPDDHADRKGQILATRRAEVIKNWASDRNAIPATVPGTQLNGDLSVLRFNFPEEGKRPLKEVTWEQWLETFIKGDMTFLFQEKRRDGAPSNFFKLDKPTTH